MPVSTLAKKDSASDKIQSIRRILIANNGLAALKFMLSIKKWSTEALFDPNFFTFISLVSDDDMRSNSAFVELTDEIVLIPGGPSKENYGNVSIIVESAILKKADAVWAGWGHASENPALPEALNDCSPPI